jgi:hypothetical protein
MSHNLNPRRGFTAFIILVILVFGSLPAQAQPVRRAASGAWKVAVLGEDALAWVRSLFTGLWSQGATKEGTSIDPNGGKAPERVTIDPNGGLDDEGMSIDPNGRS